MCKCILLAELGIRSKVLGIYLELNHAEYDAQNGCVKIRIMASGMNSYEWVNKIDMNHTG